MTPEQDRAYLNQCYELALKSPCTKAKVGALVVTVNIFGDSLGVVGSGFNQSPNPEFSDCARLCAGGIRQGVKSGTRTELCYSVHAEQYAIMQASNLARNGTIYIASFDEKGNKRLKDSSLPLGHPMHGFYCTPCARTIWAAGIARVVTDGVKGIVKLTPQDIWNTAYGVAGSI